MADDAIAEQGAAVRPLTAPSPPRELFAAAGSLERRVFRRGEVLLQPGDAALPLHLIRSGRVKVALAADTDTGEEQVVALLGAGDCVGAIAAGGARAAPVRVVAMEPTETLALPRADLLAAAAANPACLGSLSDLLALRLPRAAAYGVLAFCRHQFVRGSPNTGGNGVLDGDAGRDHARLGSPE